MFSRGEKSNKPKKQGSKYAAKKERERKRNADASAAGRDIGEIPPVKHPKIRQRAEGSLRYFCEKYFPNVFNLKWSKDHLKVIKRIEQAVLRGGLFALAMPRGSGKTSLTETACIWAMLTGAREFVCLVGSDAGHAREMLESIKVDFETNERLAEDFPEAVFPILALERIHNRANGQTYHGEPTRIKWTVDEIVLPTIKGSKASGAIIRVAGIGGRIRGMKFKKPNGQAVRPSLVILDDPQTDESARSAEQTRVRMKVLNGAILGMAGPGKKIAGVMPCTVIQPGDMASQILDREKHPIWQGERTQLAYALPTNEKLWEQYADIRAADLQANGDGSKATEFYRKHRKAMDAGAKMAWPDRFEPDELSAVQYMQNLRFQDEATFWAEYQNEPKVEKLAEDTLTVKQVLSKYNGRKRFTVPTEAGILTAFVDIHKRILFYCVVAWEEGFGGSIIDYGTFPDQHTASFTTQNTPVPLKGDSEESAIAKGVEVFVKTLLEKTYKRDDGADMKINRIEIDRNYKPRAVETALRRLGSPVNVLPARGMSVSATKKPFAEYQRKPGLKLGDHWMIPSLRGSQRGTMRRVDNDVNYWKSFVHARLAVEHGSRGCLTLWGNERTNHQMFAEHIANSETSRQVEDRATGRVVNEWTPRPSHPDNHWFDCLVGCAAAASMEGITLAGMTASKTTTKRKKVKIPKRD